MNAHALAHYHQSTGGGHSVCLNLHNSSVFCYACDEFVNNDTETNALDDLRQEFREFIDHDDTSLAAAAASSAAATTSSTTITTKKKRSTTIDQTNSGRSSSSRSTSSSDSGCGTEESTAVSSAAAASSSSVASLPPPPSPVQPPPIGRKLRPRKRTLSSDSGESALKRKTLRKVTKNTPNCRNELIFCF